MLQEHSQAGEARGMPAGPVHEPDERAHRDDLLRHLERLDLLLQRAVLRARQNTDDKHELEGLMHPDEVLESFATAGRPRWAMAVEHTGAALATGERGECTRLQQLVSRFSLSPFERDVLLLALLPWFDARYALLFSYLQEDGDKQLPTVDLALRLLGPKGWARTQLAAVLAPDAPLLRHRLLRLKHKGDAGRHWGDLSLHADRELYHHLAGHTVDPAQGAMPASRPEALVPCARWLRAPDLPDYRPELTVRLQQLCFSVDRAVVRQGRSAGIVLLRGREGSGRTVALAHAAARSGWPLLSLDLGLLPEQDDEALEVVSIALREARLHAAGLVLRRLHALVQERRRLCAQMQQPLADHAGPIAGILAPHSPLVWLEGLPHWLVDMPERSHASDEALLLHQISHVLPGTRLAPDVDLQALVRRFSPSVDTVQDTLREADQHRRARGADTPLTQGDLAAALGLRSQQNFGELAQRITPVRNFSDLVVSDDLQQQLNEILAAVRQRDSALKQGFGRKVHYGTGISVLFHGDSGTGKTMVAEVLAGALGVDLIKIDLSTVVNKYIGETEKNLARIFDLAAADAGVLFFDEADALFGKRSETKDAHDRHANIEVSYLLQRLEAHPGLVVLATNNRSHLDDAFTRRLTFITRFPFPDAALRERMWRSAWPAEIALDDAIDFGELARRVAITGANIRNTALLATWLAGEERATCIGAQHIQLALRRELGKLGRLPVSN